MSEHFILNAQTAEVHKRPSEDTAYSSSLPASPSSPFLAFFLLTRPGLPPPNGDFRLKSMCFWESRRTTNDGMLTTCFLTLMCLCLIRTLAWWIDLASPSLKT